MDLRGAKWDAVKNCSNTFRLWLQWRGNMKYAPGSPQCSLTMLDLSGSQKAWGLFGCKWYFFFFVFYVFAFFFVLSQIRNFFFVRKIKKHG